jgi:hypothetical protein
MQVRIREDLVEEWLEWLEWIQVFARLYHSRPNACHNHYQIQAPSVLGMDKQQSIDSRSSVLEPGLPRARSTIEFDSHDSSSSLTEHFNVHLPSIA